MKNVFSKIVMASFVVLTFTMSSCTKEHITCPVGYHPVQIQDPYTGRITEDCVADGPNTNPCTTCGGGTVTPPTTTNGEVLVSVLEPYKSAIITQVNAVSAFKNDGNGYAQAENSGNVSQGSSATYKRLQIWLYVGNGVFTTDFAGIDNHASGGSMSTFQQLNGLMTGNVTDFRAGRISAFNATGKYAVVTLAMGQQITTNTYEMTGSTTKVDETDRSHYVSSSNPEKFRLTTSGGFIYEVTSSQVYQGNQLFAWQ
ncbi:MAG: hypothetical protein WCG20_03965 [bacterium]